MTSLSIKCHLPLCRITTPFIGEVMKILTTTLGIKQKFTSGYHPQTNGLTERFNRTITNELAKVVNPKKDDWPKWLIAKTFAYNNSVHKSTQHTPSELNLTFTPSTPLSNELVMEPEKFRKKDWAETAKKIGEAMRQDALKQQQAAAKSQQKTYNRGLKPTKFNVGDYVRVHDPTAEAKEPVKLRNQWIGPYRIRGRKGMLWELEDLKGAKLKGLYHPIKLKLVNEEKSREGSAVADPELPVQKASAPEEGSDETDSELSMQEASTSEGEEDEEILEFHSDDDKKTTMPVASSTGGEV